MSEDFRDVTKYRQRRYTIDIKKADDSPYSNSNSKSSSFSMIPQALKYFAPLLNTHHMTIGEIAASSSKLLRELTKSSWVEVMLKEDNRLIIYNPMQPFISLEINDESLPGYVAQTQHPELITNPHTSTFYSGFLHKINPFSPATNKVIQPTTTACIPLIVNTWEVIGVVQLFNKVGEDLAQSYYSEIDVDIVNSFSEIVSQALSQRKEYLDLLNKNEAQHSMSKAKSKLSREMNIICRKKEYCKKIDEIIKPWYKISKGLIDAITDIMQIDGLVLYSISEGQLKCEYKKGVDMEISDNKSRISEYVGFTHKEILNIRDLSIEPLWPQDTNYGYKSCLVCPILNYNNNVQGVIEFYRANSTFTEIDENFGQFLMASLSKMTKLTVDNNNTDFEQHDLRK